MFIRPRHLPRPNTVISMGWYLVRTKTDAKDMFGMAAYVEANSPEEAKERAEEHDDLFNALGKYFTKVEEVEYDESEGSMEDLIKKKNMHANVGIKQNGDVIRK